MLRPETCAGVPTAMIKSLPIAVLLGLLVLLGHPGHAQAKVIVRIIQIIKHPGFWGVIKRPGLWGAFIVIPTREVIPRDWLHAPDDPKSPDPRCKSLTTEQRQETWVCQ
jgi:hypothetical protein